MDSTLKPTRKSKESPSGLRGPSSGVSSDGDSHITRNNVSVNSRSSMRKKKVTESKANDLSTKRFGVVISLAGHSANDPCEDTYAIERDKDLLDWGSGIFCGIFDGHGGKRVSEMLKNETHAQFLASLNELKDNPPVPLLSPGVKGPSQFSLTASLVESAFIDAYKKLDKKYIDLLEERIKLGVPDDQLGLDDGSCASSVYLIPKYRLLVCANLGDSRAIIGRMNDMGIVESFALSDDHATNSDRERWRIRREHPSDSRVLIETWDDEWEEYAFLLKGSARFTRSVGDAIFKSKDCANYYNLNPKTPIDRTIRPLPQLKKPYLSNLTECTAIELSPDVRFVLLACDGFWDEVTNQEAAQVASSLLIQYGSKSDTASFLLDYALHKVISRLEIEHPELGLDDIDDLKAVPPGYGGRRELHDDITIIFIYLDWKSEPYVSRKFYRFADVLSSFGPPIPEDFRSVTLSNNNVSTGNKDSKQYNAPQPIQINGVGNLMHNDISISAGPSIDNAAENHEINLVTADVTASAQQEYSSYSVTRLIELLEEFDISYANCLATEDYIRLLVQRRVQTAVGKVKEKYKRKEDNQKKKLSKKGIDKIAAPVKLNDYIS